MQKKDGLTSFHFFSFLNGPKMGEKNGITPLHFLKNEPNMGKKDELSPLNF